MALRWTSAAMCEAAKGFRKLKAHKQLPALREALAALQAKHAGGKLTRAPSLHRLFNQQRPPSQFQHRLGHSRSLATIMLLLCS